MTAGARFLVNPGARRGADALERVNRLRTLAGRAGAGFVVSRGAGDLAEQARRTAEDGVERLLVAGGDGSMHHAIQGLAGTSCALGVIPMGSGNDLAAVLGAPREPEAAVQAALAGPIRRMDLIRMGETFSASYIGIGFDSEVTRVANGVKRLRGPLIYPYAVFRTLAGFRPPFLKIVHDEGTFEGRVMFVTLANIDRFGGGMRIAPMASFDDGVLDLVIVQETSKLTLLSVFPKVYGGKHVGHPAVGFVRTRRVEITADRDFEVYGGGELMRTLAAGETLAAEVVPAGLRVVG
ncbi:MAG TPA: diacylglycerol kinase family protein [Thermoanaerobaculia bacterium]